MMAPAETPNSIVPEQAQVQSAAAWYYTHAMCDGSFQRGDWLQHKDRTNLYHRSVRLDKYQYNGYVYVNIRKVKVHYSPYWTDSVGRYPVRCWPA